VSRNLLDRRLILVAGKGGVGRSTVAASIAAAAARRGRKTLLFEANANDRYGAFFGKSFEVGTEIVRLRENLYAVNTNPTAALEEYGLMVLRFRRVYRMVFENRITKYFLRAIPGLDDYSIIGKAWFHTEEERRGRPLWDTVVFDLPASGHSLSMLKIPYVILDTVPEGPLTRDARKLVALLQDSARTALVLVTLAEEMPSNEARELSDSLERDLSLEAAHLLINQVYPDRFPEGSPEAEILDRLVAHVPASQSPDPVTRAGARGEIADIDADVAAVTAHAELAARRRKLNERYLARLADTIRAPQSQLPLLFSPSLGPEQIEELSQRIEAAFERAAAS
jgi:anion-transporting  ArsA/GET3 family ATPase